MSQSLLLKVLTAFACSICFVGVSFGQQALVSSGKLRVVYTLTPGDVYQHAIYLEPSTVDPAASVPSVFGCSFNLIYFAPTGNVTQRDRSIYQTLLTAAAAGVPFTGYYTKTTGVTPGGAAAGTKFCTLDRIDLHF
jgi:hypothetical protein